MSTLQTAKFTSATKNDNSNSEINCAILFQQLYDQIEDNLMGLRRKIPKQSNMTNTTNRSMEQQNTDYIQELTRELGQLQDYVCAQPDDLIKQFQFKKMIVEYNDQINKSKVQISQIDIEMKNHEVRLNCAQEKSNQYSQLLQKLQDKQSQSDTVTKILDSSQQWGKIKNLFDVDILLSSVSVGYIIRLQLLLLREIELMMSNQSLKQLQEEKKLLILEINSQHNLINQSLSFDQMILNIIHYNNKTGLFQILHKCLQSFHSNFCQFAQNLNKHNLSHRIFEENQRDLNNQLNFQKQLQTQKSQMIIEYDKCKKKVKDIQAQINFLQNKEECSIEDEANNLLNLYLKDKSSIMKEIKYKYGKQYHDHMILDVKQEFKQICQKQHQQQIIEFEQSCDKINKIKELILKNGQQSQVRDETLVVQQVDKNDYIVQLQQHKIQLLQLENKKHYTIDTLYKIQQQLDALCQEIDSYFIFKKRSDSIDTVKRNNAKDHQRSASHVPQIQIQLLDIQLPVSNNEEILESEEDPIQKKKNHEWSSYQLSFNPLKSISNISAQVEDSFLTKKESSIKGCLLDLMQGNILCLLQLQGGKNYDPILNCNDDPAQFGYDIYRIDQQGLIYTSKEKENINSYNQQIYKVDLKSFRMDHCSENAIKFQKIYEPSIRQICQDSLALRHLNVKFLPFSFKSNDQLIKGLSFNEEELVKLSKLQYSS